MAVWGSEFTLVHEARAREGNHSSSQPTHPDAKGLSQRVHQAFTMPNLGTISHTADGQMSIKTKLELLQPL